MADYATIVESIYRLHSPRCVIMIRYTQCLAHTLDPVLKDVGKPQDAQDYMLHKGTGEISVPEKVCLNKGKS